MSTAKRVGSKVQNRRGVGRSRDTWLDGLSDEVGAHEDLTAARDEVLAVLSEAYEQARRSRGRVRLFGAEVHMLLPPSRSLSAHGFASLSADDPALELTKLN